MSAARFALLAFVALGCSKYKQDLELLCDPEPRIAEVDRKALATSGLDAIQKEKILVDAIGKALRSDKGKELWVDYTSHRLDRRAVADRFRAEAKSAGIATCKYADEIALTDDRNIVRAMCRHGAAQFLEKYPKSDYPEAIKLRSLPENQREQTLLNDAKVLGVPCAPVPF